MVAPTVPALVVMIACGLIIIDQSPLYKRLYRLVGIPLNACAQTDISLLQGTLGARANASANEKINL